MFIFVQSYLYVFNVCLTTSTLLQKDTFLYVVHVEKLANPNIYSISSSPPPPPPQLIYFITTCEGSLRGMTLATFLSLLQINFRKDYSCCISFTFHWLHFEPASNLSGKYTLNLYYPSTRLRSYFSTIFVTQLHMYTHMILSKVLYED